MISGVVKRGVDSCGDFLGITEPGSSLTWVDVAAMALKERGRKFVARHRLVQDQSRPIRSAKSVIEANWVTGELIPEQIRFGLFALKVERVQSGVDPALRVVRVLVELSVGFP